MKIKNDNVKHIIMIISVLTVLLFGCEKAEETERSANSIWNDIQCKVPSEISCNDIFIEMYGEPVAFVSEGMEKWVRESLGYDIEEGEIVREKHLKEMKRLDISIETEEDLEQIVLTKEDMEKMISVESVVIEIKPEVTREWISGYENLKYIPNLNYISIQDTQLRDYSFLAECEELKTVTVFDSDLPENFLDNCTKLERVQIFHCQLPNSLLNNCPNLTALCASECEIPDTDIFAHLATLEEIQMDETGLKDLKFIHDMKNLKSLCVRYNEIKDISPVFALEHLERLYINDNELATFNKEKLPDSLIWLAIAGNEKVEISTKDFETYAVMELWRYWEESLDTYKEELQQAQTAYNLLDLEGNWSKIEADGKDADNWNYEEIRDDLECEIAECFSGDIDGNGMEDLGVVVNALAEDGFIEGRWIYVYPKTANGYEKPYRPIALSLPSEAGAAWDDSINGIIISEQKLIVQYVQGTSNSSYTTVIYSYDEEHWKEEMNITSGFSFVSDGIIHSIRDYKNQWFTKYMIGRNENGYYERVLTGNHSMDESPYIGMPVFSMAYTEFSVHHELYEMPFTTTQALEAVMETQFANCNKEKRQNNPVLVEGYEKILGIDIPDYYYVVKTENELVVVHFEDWTDWEKEGDVPMYKIIVEAYDEEKNAVTAEVDSYIYNSQTGKREPDHAFQY